MGYLSFESLVAYAITAFLAYWAWHDQQHRLGRKKHPFFSRGGQHRARRPRAAAPARARSQSTGNEAEVMEGIRRITGYTHNQETAYRLLKHTWEMNRGQSIEWCTEKCIDDLIRDRR